MILRYGTWVISQSNVLIGQDGKPVLSDFGFTRIRHELTRTGTQDSGIGAIQYLAPEFFSGDITRGTVMTDTYACSFTILELATGDWPFAHIANKLHVVPLVLRGDRPPMPANMGPFLIDSDAGQRIWTLLVQMWDQWPINRPPLATVKARLDVIREDGTVISPSTTSEVDCNRPKMCNCEDLMPVNCMPLSQTNFNLSPHSELPISAPLVVQKFVDLPAARTTAFSVLIFFAQ